MKFYLVGGFVRSLFTREQTKDIDICVTGTTYTKLLDFLLYNNGGVQVILPELKYHNLFFHESTDQLPNDSNRTAYNMGVIKAKVGGQVIDFCLARRELDADYTQDSVVPVTVVNTPDVTIEEDLARRDFTCGALALPIYFALLHRGYGAVRLDMVDCIGLKDPYNGRQHIEEKVLHTVGSAFDRFSADPTRILRALKFALRLDMQLSAEIQAVLWEREHELCTLYEQKINPDRSSNELTQVFKQAPSWRVMQAFANYIPPSLLRSLFCDSKINLYPSLKNNV